MKTILVPILLLALAAPAHTEPLFRYAPNGVLKAEVAPREKNGHYNWFFDGVQCYAAKVDKKTTVFVQCDDGDNMLMHRSGNKVVVNFKNGAQESFKKGTILYDMHKAIINHHQKVIRL